MLRRIFAAVMAIVLLCGCAGLAQEEEFLFREESGECLVTGYNGAGGTVVIPSQWNGMPVVGIDISAFEKNRTITEIVLPNSVRTIGDAAFWSCTELENIVFGEGLEKIDAWAFAGCTNLTKVALPSSTVSVGDYAFGGCTNLETFSFYAGTELHENALSNTPAHDNVTIIPRIVLSATPLPVIALMPVATPAPVATLAPVVTPVPVPTPTPAPVFVEEDVPGADEFVGKYEFTASSVCTPCSNDVTERCALDGDLTTAWNTMMQSVGEWYTFRMPDNARVRLAGFRIVNGYIKTDEIYHWNARVRRIALYCDGKYVQSFAVEDDKSMQTFWLDVPVFGSNFRLEVEQAYMGNRYKDLAITEIELLGMDNRDFSTGDLTRWGRAVDALDELLSGGGSLERNNKCYEVMGLQLLLQDGFGTRQSLPTGIFDQWTQKALLTLQDQMRTSAVSSQLKPMQDGVADKAFWENLQMYVGQK